MSQTIRFSKSSIARIPFTESKPDYYYDTEIIGLKLKVGKRRKTFVLEKRIKGHRGSAVTFTLGTFPLMNIDEARQKARSFANLCEQGQDPRASLPSAKKRVVTLQEAADKFFSVSTHLSPKSIKNYKAYLRNQFSDWLHRDMGTITVDDVVEKYYELVAQYVTQSKKAMTFLSVLWDRVAPLMRENRVRILPLNPVPEARKFVGGWTQPRPRRDVVPLHKLGQWMVTIDRLHTALSPFPAMKMTIETLLIGMLCGLRNKECRTLKWSQVDLELGVIIITRKLAKNRQEHAAPLSSQAWNVMKEIHANRTSLSPYVWPKVNPKKGESYQPLPRNQKVYETFSDELGYHFRPHAARRTFTSIGHHLEIPWFTLKRMLNHKYQGGVTGGYIVPEFDPTHNRKYFQMVSDLLFEKKREYLQGERHSA